MGDYGPSAVGSFDTDRDLRPHICSNEEVAAKGASRVVHLESYELQEGNRMKQNGLYLGIDYGGNSVKAGLFDSIGTMHGKTSWPTVALMDLGECQRFAEGVAEFVRSLGLRASDVSGVGLAMPGMIAEGGYFCPNVSVDVEVLAECLSETFSSTSVSIINDANAAAFGEMWKGAGIEAGTALLATLGSGLGSGIIVNGNVVTGAHGAAGELGHVTVEPDGRLCSCGRKGCAERYASARGLVQTFTEATDDAGLDASLFSEFEPASATDALPVFKAYEVGDPRAVRAIEVMVDKLAFASAQVACIVDPEIIILGGGVSGGSKYFIEDLRSAFRSYCLPACSSTEIRVAVLGNDAGMYGAARYAMQSANEKEC